MWATAILACVAALAQTSIAVPTGHVLHEKRDVPHMEEWHKTGRANPYQLLPVRIALKEQNTENIEKYLMDVADPASPNFGNHWTAEQVANAFRPSQKTHDSVAAWLEKTGILPSRVSKSTGHNWLEFDATVAEMENLLATEYHVYEHLPTDNAMAACDHYHVPQHLQNHIDFIMPTIQLDGLRPLEKKSKIAKRDDLSVIKQKFPIVKILDEAPGLTGTENCDRLVTIDCLRALYNFTYQPNATTGNQLGIVEWSDYLYAPDLQIFLQNYTNPQIPNNTFPEFISIDGGKPANLTVANAAEVVESALDFDTAYSIVYPQGIRLYQVGDSVNVNSVGTFNIFLDALDASYCTYDGGDDSQYDPKYPDPKAGGYKGPLQCGGAPLSNVFSFSYSQTEAKLSASYQQRQCNEWAKLGMQGVSVLFASGDSGVGTRFNAGFPDKCLERNSNKLSVNGTRFAPGFPVNCPYVTAVGATTLVTGEIADGETAATLSGGGFSNVFKMPSYQATAVNGFLKTYSPKYTKHRFNHSGSRAYPDVSAIGVNLPTVYLGNVYGIGGTSASTPIVASLVTLLNEKRLEIGKKPIGFLNPLFYANPTAFNDITTGYNANCNSSGFHAQTGWDPVTGLGTPNFEALLKVFLAAP